MYEDYLRHSGVKGMKWGVRKDRKSSSSSRSRKIKQRIQTKKKQLQKQWKKNQNINKQIRSVKKSRRQASKKRMLLSDSELDTRINRLAKEKQLKELTDEQVSPGRTFVKKKLEESGGKSINAVSSFGIEIGKSYVKSALGTSNKKK